MKNACRMCCFPLPLLKVLYFQSVKCRTHGFPIPAKMLRSIFPTLSKRLSQLQFSMPFLLDLKNNTGKTLPVHHYILISIARTPLTVFNRARSLRFASPYRRPCLHVRLRVRCRFPSSPHTALEPQKAPRRSNRRFPTQAALSVSSLSKHFP